MDVLYYVRIVKMKKSNFCSIRRGKLGEFLTDIRLH